MVCPLQENMYVQCHVYTCMSHLTESEKSPGVLSLSLIKKAPSFCCRTRISSALARVIRPRYQLERRRVPEYIMSQNMLMPYMVCMRLYVHYI